jgi:hypothetical protein
MSKPLALSVGKSFEVYCSNHGMAREDMTFFDKQMALMLAAMEPPTSRVWVPATLEEDEEQAQEPKT